MKKWFKRLWKLDIKFLESIIRNSLRIAIVFALITIIFILITLICDYDFCLSKNCLDTFLKLIFDYKLLFSSLLVLTTIVISIESFKEVKKNNKKDIWFKILKEELEYIKPINSYIYRNVLLKTNRLYDFAYEYDFEFKNYQTLKDFFTHFIEKCTIFMYEAYDEDAKRYQNTYPNKEFTFSEDKFLNVLMRIMQPAEEYDAKSFKEDYLRLYRENLFSCDEFDDKKIND